LDEPCILTRPAALPEMGVVEVVLVKAPELAIFAIGAASMVEAAAILNKGEVGGVREVIADDAAARPSRSGIVDWLCPKGG